MAHKAVLSFQLLVLCLVAVFSPNACQAESNWLYTYPNQVNFSSVGAADFIQVHYGYDPQIPELFIAINISSAHAPGEQVIDLLQSHLSVGFRPMANFSHVVPSMGPAHIAHIYTRGTDLSQCMLYSHLPTAGNYKPIGGQGAAQKWRMRGLRTVHKPGDNYSTAEFQLYPFQVPTGATFVEMILSIGKQNGEMMTSTAAEECIVPPKHDIFKARVNLTLAGEFYYRPYAVWGCANGVPSFSATGTACIECNDKFAGTGCTVECDCGTTTGKCSATVNSTAASCGSCDPGKYGTLCKSECGCVTKNTLSCSDGPAGNGVCTCKPGYGGKFCDNCDSMHFGANCTSMCLCENGICSSGYTGNGRCSSCNSDYSGRYCNVSCPVCAADEICSSGVGGDGTCVKINPPTSSGGVITPSPAGGTPPPTFPSEVSKVALALDQDIQSFNSTEFKSTIAASLGIGPSNVNVLRVIPGSVIVEMELWGLDAALTQQKYAELDSKVGNKDSSLAALNVVAMTTDSEGMSFPPNLFSTLPPATDAPPTIAPMNNSQPPLVPQTPENSNTSLIIVIVGSILGVAVLAALIALVVFYGCNDSEGESRPKTPPPKAKIVTNEQDADLDDQTSDVGSPPQARYAFGSAEKSMNSSAVVDMHASTDKPNVDGVGGSGSRSQSPATLGEKESFSQSYGSQRLTAFRNDLLGSDSDDGSGGKVERPVYSPKFSPSATPPGSRSMSFRKGPAGNAQGSPLGRSSMATFEGQSPTRTPNRTPRQMEGSSRSNEQGEASGRAVTPPVTPPPMKVEIPRSEAEPPTPKHLANTPPPLPPAPKDMSEFEFHKKRVEEARSASKQVTDMLGTPREEAKQPQHQRQESQDEKSHSQETIRSSDDLRDSKTGQMELRSKPPTPPPNMLVASSTQSLKQDRPSTASSVDTAASYQHPNRLGSSPGTSPSVSRPNSANFGVVFSSQERPNSGKKSAKRCKFCGEAFSTAPDVCVIEGRPHAALKQERKAEKKAKKEVKKKLLEENWNLYEEAGKHAELDTDDETQ